jgi:hypothetical protein
VTKNQTFNCTIWEAARATLAFPDLFPPTEIRQGLLVHKYVGGVMGLSNPSNEVIGEFESQCSHGKIEALISIGAGHGGVIQLTDSSSSSLNAMLKQVAANCELAAQSLEKRLHDQGIYFRLSVEQGLQRDGNTQVDLGEIDAHTRAYLESHPSMDVVVDGVVECLRGDLDAPDPTSTRRRFTQIMNQYIEDLDDLVADIQAREIKTVVQVSVAIMELVKVSEWFEHAISQLIRVRLLAHTRNNGFTLPR